MRTTRDVHLDFTQFPCRDLVGVVPLSATAWTLSRQFYADVGARAAEVDFRVREYDGARICLKCKGVIESGPPTCEACLRLLRDGIGVHPRGRPGPGCLKARCGGHASSMGVDAAAATAPRKRTRSSAQTGS